MAENSTLKSTSKLLLDENGRPNGHAKAFEDDICVYGRAGPVLEALDYLKGPDGLATVGLTVVPSKTVCIVPPTAKNYTGTEADYDRLKVPASLRPPADGPWEREGEAAGALLGRKGGEMDSGPRLL